MDRSRPWREPSIGRHHKPPAPPDLLPHCSHMGGSVSEGGKSSHLPLNPCFPCVGQGGEGGRDIYLFPLFI